jgi:hypothetical protein
MRSEQINELAAALVTAQGEFSAVPKNSTNPFFKSKYADLATVVETAAPVVAKNGLAVSQYIDTLEDNSNALTTYLMHKSGQFIAHTMPLMLSKADAQGQGSAITYARRYAYMAVLGLVADEDDDGNAATKATVSTPTAASDKRAAQTVPSLVSPDLVKKVKELMADKGLVGEQAIEFSKTHIYKNAPINTKEWETLLVALTDEPF